MLPEPDFTNLSPDFISFADSLPQLVWCLQADGKFLYFNRQWYAYTGLSFEASADWQAVLHPEDYPRFISGWQHSRSRGEPYQVEHRLRRQDGTYRWFLSRVQPQTDPPGNFRRWFGTSTEMEDRQAPEQTTGDRQSQPPGTATGIHTPQQVIQPLEEREAYFRRMADKVPVMIWMTRPDGYCTYLNQTWYAYTGQTESEALGMGWLSATHPEDFSRSKSIFEAANASQRAFQLLYRLRRRDGTYRWFLDKGEPQYDASGNFSGFVGAVIDVHEQQRAEQRLLLSVKAGKVGIFEWDTVNNRATYSDILQEMLGFRAGALPDEFEGAYQVYQNVIHPDDRELVNRQVARVLRDVQKEFYVEFRIVKPTGEIAWIAERGEVIFADGQPVQMNGTCMDITSRRQAEEATQRLADELAATNEELQAANEELSQSNQQLARINADLDTFVYTASHDLKAPIINIEGLLNALERQLNRENREFTSIAPIYELLYQSVNRFKATIRDLTDVARVGKENPEDVARIDLNEVLAEVRQDLEPSIQESGARLVITLDCPSIYFSRKNLKSILYNLLSNAIKYRSPDRLPLIHISCRPENEYVVFSVADNGLGIDMSQEEKIFALFKRLHSHVEGTGIGLYIVKKMIENAGGRIQVSSQPGKGSEFTVYFHQPSA